MADRYVGLTDGVWAAGTASASVPSLGYSTLTDAITAASNGDSIWLQAGSYTLPGTISKALKFHGQNRSTVVLTANGAEVTGSQVTFDSVKFADKLLVSGSCAFVRCFCDVDTLAEAVKSGKVVAAGCEGDVIAGTALASAANYPWTHRNLGGSYRIAHRYRSLVTVEAASKRKLANGQYQFDAWLELGTLRVNFDEAGAREAVQARMLVAEATGRAFARSGFPVSPDMRLKYGDRILEIRGVLMQSAPMNEIEILYAERVKG